MTDFKSDTKINDQKHSNAFSTCSGSMSTSSSSSKVDISVHVEVCLQFFSRLLVLKTVQAENATRPSNNASRNLALVYQEASRLLEVLSTSNCLSQLLTAVRFMESNYESTPSSGLSCSSFATSIVQDLVLLTSFACSNALEQSKIARANESNESTSSSVTGDSLGSRYEDNAFFWGNGQYQSVTATLIALAPYWAIATLIVQGNKAENESKSALKSALVHFLRTPLAFKACCDLSEDCLERLAFTEQKYLQTVAPSAVLLHHHELHLLQQQHQESLLMHITNRLRKGLRSHLHHPLLFCLVMSLSLRHDLSVKVRSSLTTSASKESQTMFDRLLEQSDVNCLDLTELLVTIAPKLVMKADITNQQCSPLIYVTAHRASFPQVGGNAVMAATMPSLSSESLVLGFVQIITDYVPSALTICDHRGMYPLHYAARRGYSKVLSYLANRFGGFTLALMDHSNKYPLHHALLSHHLHSEDDIVSLASLSPQLLDASINTTYETTANNSVEMGNTAFKLLQFAKKISFSLYDRLSECLSRWREAEQLQWQCPIYSWRNHRQVTAEISPAKCVETIHSSTISSLKSVNSSDESLKSRDEEDEEAVLSLQFFAQSLLMLQRAAASYGPLEPVSVVPSFVNNSNIHGNNSKIVVEKLQHRKKAKRPASEIAPCSLVSIKKPKRVDSTKIAIEGDVAKSLLVPTMALLDGLTSGESSITSLEANATSLNC